MRPVSQVSTRIKLGQIFEIKFFSKPLCHTLFWRKARSSARKHQTNPVFKVQLISDALKILNDVLTYLPQSK